MDIETNRVTARLFDWLKQDYTDSKSQSSPVRGDKSNFQIAPWDLFRRSLEEANGDIYVALRSAYNVTREARLHPLLCRKFTNITGGDPANNDNCGNVYHFFGLMKIRFLGKYYGRTAVYFDTDNDIDPKELEYNCAGLNTMNALLRKLAPHTVTRVDTGEEHFINLDRKAPPRCNAVKALGLSTYTRPQKGFSTRDEANDDNEGVRVTERISLFGLGAAASMIPAIHPCEKFLPKTSTGTGTTQDTVHGMK